MGCGRGGIATSRGRGGIARGCGRGGRARGRGRGSRVRGCGAKCVTGHGGEFYTNNSTALTYSGGVPGPTGLAVGVTDPIDCFHLFMTSDIYDDLLVQTYLYADQQRAAKNDTSQWTPISKEELMAFIGINIAMHRVSSNIGRLLPHPCSHMVLYHHVTKSIPTDFAICSHCLQFNSSSSECSDLRPIVEGAATHSCCLEQCIELYTPHRKLSIDESMIGTKCRLSFIQYMPKNQPSGVGHVVIPSMATYTASMCILVPIHPSQLILRA